MSPRLAQAQHDIKPFSKGAFQILSCKDELITPIEDLILAYNPSPFILAEQLLCQIVVIKHFDIEVALPFAYSWEST